jgi:hypothetical protein
MKFLLFLNLLSDNINMEICLSFALYGCEA